ncbi:MAG TPA: MGMT family protein [Nanoarchaeota archaeon]|nr:MGMT family protein [Nanoarchaeota archaeon]
MRTGDFPNRVYMLVRKVPYGKVTTYKAIAKALNTKAYRAVGNALNKNKNIELVKCCKVVKSDGSIGGYSEGTEEKAKRLKKEGIQVKGGKIVDFQKRLLRFNNK